MSDERKLTLSGKSTSDGMKPTDGAKPVRPGLPSRRSKPVVVERKRRRILRKGDETPSSPVIVEENISLKPKKPSGEARVAEEDKLTSQERDARIEALKDAIRVAEEDRMRAAEEQRQRTEQQKKEKAELKDEAKHQVEEDAKKKVEEEARQRAAAEEEAKLILEEEEAKRAKAEAQPVKTQKTEDARPHKKEPEKKRHANLRKKGGERRRSGKLTVANALEGGDEMRPRSLAALKRAQAKQKRALGDSDASQKKSREVVVPEAITVQELANRMAEKATAVIRVLMNMGVTGTINEVLDQDTAELVVTEFGHTIKRVSESDVEIGLFSEKDDPKTMKTRPAVVTIMGHVDHGKTSLLDALRSTDVVAGEAGGITQHIGAYQVTLKNNQKITFLDTPGHEAFTQMRSRGANVTDIVVLVVAADDSVMPQTIEAINHAKAAKVPMIVAINKMDVKGADADKVRNELLQHEVIVEKLSGDVLDVEVSATKKTNLDKLEEIILLQAELLDLKANPDRSAEGTVIEAKLDKGRGTVATMLVQRGTLKPGDIIVAGSEWGKVRAIVDDHGKQVKAADPSSPVEVLGLNGAPDAGDSFSVVENEARAREVTQYRKDQTRKEKTLRATVPLESMFSAMKEAKADSFPVVLKADVQGSVEAITAALEKIGNEEIQANVLHGAAGGITESDVTLASASNAVIIGFNVRANKQAREIAEKEHVLIQYYSVIYDLVDVVRAAMEGRLSPALEESTLGLFEIKDVFSAGKGKAAGGIVADGVMKVGAEVRLLRDETVIYTGKIETLRRFKDDVKEVKAGTECGLTLENYIDFKVGDTLEAFVTTEKKKTL